MKLICEHELNFEELHLLEEKKNNSEEKIFKVVGPYIVAEKKNANGRVYSKKFMEEAVNKFNEEFITTKRSVGELNHPESIEIDYNNACHLITGLRQEDNIWIGESTILTGTPKGDLLAGLLKNGVKVGMSTRGVGDVSKDGNVGKYNLITVDVVSNPSAGKHGSFVNGIFESKNFMIDNYGDIIEESYKKFEDNLAVLPKNTNAKNDKIVESITEFLKNLKL
jgi:hypothetical protein